MTPSITGHMVVKNEDRFIWYSISSVLPFLNRLLITDTGSADETRRIINSFNSPKIKFDRCNSINSDKLVKIRQQQIDETDTDWIWVVDGDEVYPAQTAQKAVDISKNKNLFGIIIQRYDLLGDIYHCQSGKVGSYDQFGTRGHYVLRLINKRNIDGLRVIGKYPDEYYADLKGNNIKSAGKSKYAFINERIFHAMYLNRSTLGNNSTLNRKTKMEIGKIINKEEIPAVFFSQSRPEYIPDVTGRISFKYIFVARPVTWLKKIKRAIFQ